SQQNIANFVSPAGRAPAGFRSEFDMFYQLYELNHAAMQPFRAYAEAMRQLYSNPLNPVTDTPFGRSIAAAAELFERTTRRYGKPTFGLTSTKVGSNEVA